MPRHKNSATGRWETVDRLPFFDCACMKCHNAKLRQMSGALGQSERKFPADNGAVGGQSAYVQQDGSRTVGYFGQDHEGKIVSNDGVNAAYLRDDQGNVSINYKQDSDDDPYAEYNRRD